MDYIVYVSDSDPASKMIFKYKILCNSCGDRGMHEHEVFIQNRSFRVHFGCEDCKDEAFHISFSPLSVVIHQPFLSNATVYIEEARVYV